MNQPEKMPLKDVPPPPASLVGPAPPSAIVAAPVEYIVGWSTKFGKAYRQAEGQDPEFTDDIDGTGFA